MKGSLVAACCLGTVLWAQSKPAQTPANELVFTNVNVVDTRDGGIRENMTVVVTDGRIRAIAKLGLIGSARNLHVVNANGKYLIPGLWDMHSHRGHTSGWDDNLLFALYLANGVTGIRESVDLPVSLAHASGVDVLIPHITSTGDFAEVRRAVSAHEPDRSHRPFGLGKLLGAGATNSFLAEPPEISGDYGPSNQTVESHSESSDSLPARRTIEHLDSMMLASSSQQDELEWEINRALRSHDLDAYAAAERKVLSTYDPNKAYNLALQLAMNGTYDVPDLVWSQAVGHFDSTASANESRLKYVPHAIRAQWSPDALEARTSPQLRSVFKQRANQDLQLMHVIRRAGLQVLAGTGAPGTEIIPGFALHDELALLVQCGFTPLQALQSATFTPALFMAKLDHYGVVEPGRDADLVLLDGNPLSDIYNLDRISAVIMGGKYYSRDDLDHMLAHAAEIAKGMQ